MRPSHLLPLLTLVLASCHASKHAVKPVDATATPEVAAVSHATASQVASTCALKAKTQYLTARLSTSLAFGDKSFDTGGTLRMRRDDVVQLSLTFLGAEVGRLEFRSDSVLVIDRLNKQYVLAAYGEVDFLRRAGLDFTALQALFWNEVFLPSEQDATVAPERFRTSRSGDFTLLRVADAPLLEYGFLTRTRTGRVERVDITPKNPSESGSVAYTYASPASIAGTTFPTEHVLRISGTGTEIQLSLRLSRLTTSADWTPRTTPKASYKRISAASLEKMLRNLTF